MAAAEPLCAGLVGYMWPGGFDCPEQLGVRDMPHNVKNLNLKIGKMIKSNNSMCPDTEAPLSPTGLSSGNITSTSFSVSWIALKDNIRVISYEVFIDGESHGSTKRTFMGITGLSCNTAYSITVRASHAAGNQSEGAALSVTTSACSTEKPVK